MRPVLNEISWVVVGYAALVTLVSAYAAYRWRMRPPWLASLAWMLEFLAAVRAAFGLLGLGEITADNRVTHLGYLVASLCIVPLAVRSVEGDDSIWSIGVIGIAALAVCVISVRMVMTL